MANVLLPIEAGTLPPPWCYPPNTQDLLVQFADHMSAVLPGMAFYNFGDTKPSPELSIYPWLYQAQMRWYFFDGVWISPNPETSNQVLRIFTGDTTALSVYDGGDTDPDSDRTGPMWEIASEFANHYPIGVGSIAGLGVSIDNFSYTLSSNNIPLHSHKIAVPGRQGGGSPLLNEDVPMAAQGGGQDQENYNLLSFTGKVPTDATYGPTSPFGKDPADPVPVYGPVIGSYFIRRTNRIYYSIS